jgi:hypothetical protein
MSAGKLSIGAVVSTTETVKLPVLVLPRESDTEQFTVVGPSGNVDPDAGLHDGVIGPSTLSFADAK